MLGIFCTIQDDNGELGIPSPNNPQTKPPVPTITPALFVNADSAYVRINDTIVVHVRVFSDSSQADNSTPLMNARITVQASRGWLSDDTLISDANGRASVKFRDSVSGRVEVTCKVNGATQVLRFDVTNTPDKIEKAIIALPEKASIKADGQDFTYINVRVINQNHNPIANECVQFITSKGVISGDGTCSNSGQSKTNADGIAKAKLLSTNVNDTAYITAYLVSDQSQSDETSVAFEGVTINVVTDKSNIHSGDTVSITATVKNASGADVAQAPIFFSLEKNTQILRILRADSVTDFKGVARVKVVGNTTGTDAVKITSSGVSVSSQINVSNLSLSLSLNKSVLQTKESDSAELTVLFATKASVALPNRAITLKRVYKTSSGADTSDLLTGTTDVLGKCRFTIKALLYETTMRLEVSGYDQTEGYASRDTLVQFITTRIMTISALPPIIQADGSSSSQITVFIKTKTNNPVIGDKVLFESTAGMITASDTTNKMGQAVATLTSDRRNTVATVTATLASDPLKKQTILVDFVGVELAAFANPPCISGSGKDTSTITITLRDAMKNVIAGEPVNFSRQQDKTIILSADSVTNNRGEAKCKVVGTGSGYDTIKVSAAGASSSTLISYSTNLLSIDTAAGQLCIANGKDSTRLVVTYLKGDKVTPVAGANIQISATLGKIDSVFFARTYTTDANGKVTFYIKNPSFANTSSIFVLAKSASEMTTTTMNLYFRANNVAKIILSGTPEVISTNGAKAKITATAFDSAGNRVNGALISFNMLSGPGGGEHLEPATAATGIDGVATTDLVSGATPSTHRQVLVQASDFSSVKSDTVKFTIAGPPAFITIRSNVIKGENPNDGTFALPCAAIVTDVNGNPVADGTEVTFSVKVSGYLIKRPVARIIEVASQGAFSCNVQIDTTFEILPFEDFNDNFKLDPGEDLNGDGVLNRGEDINGDGKYIRGPAFFDYNRDGKRQFNPLVPVEMVNRCSNGATRYADFNANGVWDPIEPLADVNYLQAYSALLADSAFERYPVIETRDSVNFKIIRSLDSAYRATPGYIPSLGHFDLDFDWNNIPDPQTTVSIKRTVQTIGGKALNKIMYGQSDAGKIEAMIWAECQGIITKTPEKLILPIVSDK